MANLKKLGAFALIAVLGILGISGSSAVKGIDSYVAKVSLSGDMTLKFYNETYPISVEKNFTAIVPLAITPGEYKDTFEGIAWIDEENVGFSGVIMTENGTFMAEFAVQNVWTGIPTGKCGASGTLTITLSPVEGMPGPPPPPPPPEYWVHVFGPVTQYGLNASRGWLDAYAKISSEENVTAAHVFWMPMPPWEENPTGNFTFSFYHARLINTTMVALNYSGNDFYVSGLWTVYNVTFTYHEYQGEGAGFTYEDYQQDILYVAENRTGELKVYGNWMNFTVSIDGFNDVKGLVMHFATHAPVCLEGDIEGRGKVDIYDLVHVARYVGCTPKTPSDLEEIEKADVNHDGHVDIYDLVTVGTEIGQTG
jgi:hypothetical protein